MRDDCDCEILKSKNAYDRLWQKNTHTEFFIIDISKACKR